ncbi:hypothetical protein ABT174_39270, partial [Streptomyces sparsogenes]
QVKVIYGRNGMVIPLLMVATAWYVFLTSVLSVPGPRLTVGARPRGSPGPAPRARPRTTSRSTPRSRRPPGRRAARPARSPR